MYSIRKTKTASKSTAIQVVSYCNRKVVLEKHIGSAKTEEEIEVLNELAKVWIDENTNQSNLFSVLEKPRNDLLLEKYEYLGSFPTFVYEVLSKLLNNFGFEISTNQLLFDLVIMRIIQPASKLRSLELIQEYFGISHRRQTFYEQISKLVEYKDIAEKVITDVAVREFGFNFSLVFYDVTTLYFESFKSDELRKNGFSKDNKFNQPQIVIGLVVNNLGFPVTYEVFEGNKFEGHTILPVILSFKEKHKIEVLTVVADAAMISYENIKQLEKNNLKYIVGARIGNLSKDLIQEISSKLEQKDRATLKIQTPHGTLICEFSQKRFKKDTYELSKGLARAEFLLKNQAGLKRNKFLKHVSKTDFKLNTDLIEKNTLLLGIKGYYSNLRDDFSNEYIIQRYHELWHVEQAFRISKHDLEMRPIYHFKESSIRVHILMCFIALAVSKYIEIKTEKSLQHVITSLLSITDAHLLNSITKTKVIKRVSISNDTKFLLKKLSMSY